MHGELGGPAVAEETTPLHSRPRGSASGACLTRHLQALWISFFSERVFVRQKTTPEN